MAWYSRQPAAGSDAWEVCLHAGDEYEDGAVVAAPPVRALVTAKLVRDAVVALHVAREIAPRAPAMWFVAHPETAADPPAMTLVAFGTADQPAGAVVPAATFTELPVRSTDQLAAVRWFTGTGQVHQIYVAPEQRRRSIGTALLLAAGTFAVACGWPRLWGNGERTDLGEAIVTRGHDLIRRRVTARTRVLPPMTPGEPESG